MLVIDLLYTLKIEIRKCSLALKLVIQSGGEIFPHVYVPKRHMLLWNM